MKNLDTKIPEISLDPEDWDEMRSLGHRMVDDMVDYLTDIENMLRVEE